MTADRPATEPRTAPWTESGRALEREIGGDYGEEIAAIEAEAAQGAAPPHHTVIERLDRPGNRANLERAEPPAGTFFTERCSGIVCIHGDCKRHSQYGEMYCGEHGGPPEYVSDSEGAAPRAEGLPVERLARAIKSRYGLKESESEVSIFLNAIFGSGEAGHD